MIGPPGTFWIYAAIGSETGEEGQEATWCVPCREVSLVENNYACRVPPSTLPALPVVRGLTPCATQHIVRLLLPSPANPTPPHPSTTQTSWNCCHLACPQPSLRSSPLYCSGPHLCQRRCCCRLCAELCKHLLRPCAQLQPQGAVHHMEGPRLGLVLHTGIFCASTRQHLCRAVSRPLCPNSPKQSGKGQPAPVFLKPALHCDSLQLLLPAD